ncbi:efflux RND transporter periplasmic adaptor subunit [Ruegeria sp. 2012CJ41-6]|uniref:Efflux RND transporter periplasmic adaptor subunit n=1 Tax=Ruegeria spongiae TaxID=2942209 RepID=A0ABT0Q5L8_9RHOB|nr:efflux RND transporter periplasmic adaptor subunit [Ruegeria spongiae]MCL6285125.1 efflux RND transporter periplasmic adaptor subunit [Ruegeria spongiae]
MMTLVAVGWIAGGSLPATAQDTAPIPVKLFALDAVEEVRTRTFFGKVVAKETVDLAFQVGGQIVKFPAVEGEIVPKGALIAQLDQEPFELSLTRATLADEQAERDLVRMKRLEGSAVSRVSLENAQTNAELTVVQLREAEYALRQSTLLAPFDALVAYREVANFTSVSPGTHVIRVHDMSELRIEIDVPEILFQRVNDKADVTLQAKFPASDTLFPLVIREVNAETSQIGQTFRVTLGMAPPEGMQLFPGSSVRVLATIARAQGVMRIPASAVSTGDGGATSVYVFDSADGETGNLRSVPVELAVGRDGGFEVREGLNPGDEIVAAGVSVLTDGALVRRFTEFRQ